MTLQDVIEFISSRVFIAYGVPVVTLCVEWLIDQSCKEDSQAFMQLSDWRFAPSLLATALVSAPLMLATRAIAITTTQPSQRLSGDDIVLSALSFLAIAVLTHIVAVYERRVGRRHRAKKQFTSGRDLMLSAFLGVVIPNAAGVMALSATCTYASGIS